MFERLEQLRISDRETEKSNAADRREKKWNGKYASTRAPKQDNSDHMCTVCGDNKHKDRIFFCKKFRGPPLSAVNQLGACRECIGCHKGRDDFKDDYLCKNKDCKKAGFPNHHFFLCPRGEYKNGNGEILQRGSRQQNYLTDEQVKFLSELTPELAERRKEAFTNDTTVVKSSASNQLGFLEENGMSALPVIMMLMEVTANAGQKIGTLIDLASDTNFITRKATSRLHLRSQMKPWLCMEFVE
ncbi:hypothetical protein Q8A73_015600 [Channa argus]|nr:hypothetical protein Q8A73_015600 [Channa argus]